MEGLGNPFLGNHLPLGNNDFIETLHENKIDSKIRKTLTINVSLRVPIPDAGRKST